MILTYFGDGCFRFQSGERTLLVDPTNNRLKADLTLRTLVPASGGAAGAGEIAYPGEYESEGMEVTGWGVPEESTEKFLKTVFLVRWEDMSFGFLGHIARTPDAALLEEISGCDVLMVPFDGAHFLSVSDAAKIAKQVDPRLIVPSFAKKPTELLKALGQSAKEEDKFVFKKKDIAGERGRVVLLKVA